MTKVKDKVVAVTGAASGIGRALSLQLTAKGASVALSDVNEAGLQETANLLRGAVGKVTTHRVDVRRRDAVERYAADVEREHGGADIIINNAGLAARGSLEEISYEDFELVIDVNFWGVVYGTRAFLPLLRKRPEGHVVNISSLNAMVPFLNNGPYNISKYAVLGFSETLMQELGGGPIRVTCVHPGGIRTNIARNTKGARDADVAYFEERMARTMPDDAAKAIVAGIENDAEQIFVGLDAKVLATAKRLFPRWTVRKIGEWMRAL
jgi:NAD(P)-dependent dehydrogenase (short-subunit alcohol dehydrogenase family)